MKKIILDFAGGTTKEVKCSDEVYDRIVKIIKGEQGFGFNKPVRKKRKFVGMTNREWMSKNNPKCVTVGVYGGVKGCPCYFDLQNQICSQQAFLDERFCYNAEECTRCWQLPAKRNGRYILKEVKK